MQEQDKLDAADILDWDYMCQIGEFVEAPRNWNEGAKRFAHRFTSVASVEAQNTMLADLLRNATYLQSPETAEEIVATLSNSLHANEEQLREFAKTIGIKLKKG
jgi:hypothetical protein